jgi:hypothetical protein
MITMQRTNPRDPNRRARGVAFTPYSRAAVFWNKGAMSSTALNLGLEAGLRYATENPGDRSRLGRIVRAHTAADVAAIVAESVDGAEGIDDRVAYWSGFAHGVRRFLQEDNGQAPG